MLPSSIVVGQKYPIFFVSLVKPRTSPLLVLRARTSDGSTNKHAAHTHRVGLKIRFSRKTSHWSICNLPVACKAQPSLDCCECNPVFAKILIEIGIN
jgi:hypothetical protein